MLTRAQILTLLTHAPAEAVNALAEAVLAETGRADVVMNRTGLVMLPYTDSAGGTVFHLGEVLVSEARILLETPAGPGEGYALRVGRDTTAALACAVCDAALAAGYLTERIALFAGEQAAAQAEADRALLRQVETTRVEMETF